MNFDTDHFEASQQSIPSLLLRQGPSIGLTEFGSDNRSGHVSRDIWDETDPPQSSSEGPS